MMKEQKKCKYTLRLHARTKQTSQQTVLNKKNQQRESIQLAQKQPKEWIETVSANQV